VLVGDGCDLMSSLQSGRTKTIILIVRFEIVTGGKDQYDFTGI
jgi:hypothetical protein